MALWANACAGSRGLMTEEIARSSHGPARLPNSLITRERQDAALASRNLPGVVPVHPRNARTNVAASR